MLIPPRQVTSASSVVFKVLKPSLSRVCRMPIRRQVKSSSSVDYSHMVGRCEDNRCKGLLCTNLEQCIICSAETTAVAAGLSQKHGLSGRRLKWCFSLLPLTISLGSLLPQKWPGVPGWTAREDETINVLVESRTSPDAVADSCRHISSPAIWLSSLQHIECEVERCFIGLAVRTISGASQRPWNCSHGWISMNGNEIRMGWPTADRCAVFSSMERA